MHHIKSVDLKACPFCGHSANFKAETVGPNKEILAHIQCQNCNCEMNSFVSDSQGKYDQNKFDSLVLNWNIRITHQPVTLRFDEMN